MPKEYRHISQYAKEIYKLREQGLNLNEIGKSWALLINKFEISYTEKIGIIEK